MITPEDQTRHATIEMGQLFRERARLTTELQALTFEDQLCRLPNRLAFDEREFESQRTLDDAGYGRRRAVSPSAR